MVTFEPAFTAVYADTRYNETLAVLLALISFIGIDSGGAKIVILVYQKSSRVTKERK